jgi:hypothetical protein
MMAEIHQAGAHPDTSSPAPRVRTGTGTPPPAGAMVTASVVNIDGTANLDTLKGINVGDTLTIYENNDNPTQDIDSKTGMLKVVEDGVVVDRINLDPTNPSFTALAKKAWPPNARIVSLKQPYRTGILSNSTGDSLRFFGDIFDNGRLFYVEYTYDRVNNRLLRAVEPADGLPRPTGFQFNDKVLIHSVVNNPGGTPIFRYVADEQGNVVSVIITMTVATREPTAAEEAAGVRETNDQHLLTLTSTATARNVVAASTLMRTKEKTAADLEAPLWITNTISKLR